MSALRHATLVLCLILGLLGPQEVRAQAQQDEAERFRGHLQRALTLYQAQRYEESITELLAAQALRKEPRLLLNLGHAYRHLGRAEEALRHYQAFLDASPNLPATEREVVAAYMAQVRPAPDPARTPPSPDPAPAAAPARPPPSPNPAPAALLAPPPGASRPVVPKGRPWWFWGLLGLGVASVVTVAVVSARPWDSGIPPGIPLHDAHF